jgi:hypothetical protein
MMGRNCSNVGEEACIFSEEISQKPTRYRPLELVPIPKYHYADQIKENEVGWACDLYFQSSFCICGYGMISYVRKTY